MNCDYYTVKIGSVIIAKEMNLGNALILVKALFEEWDKEPSLSITVAKEEN